jgi:hypothetical protein
MQYQIQSDPNRFVVRFPAQRTLHDGLHFLWAAVVMLFAYRAAHGQVVLIVEGAIFAVAFFCFALLRIYGTSSLAVDSDFVILTRRTLGISNTRKFLRTDVERFGYSPEIKGRYHQDSYLALMVRTDLLAIGFAHNITQPEAEAIFAKLKESGSWLSETIRPIGTPWG